MAEKDIAARFPCENLSIGANGHLFFAGHDTVALASEYGTPLYLMDEARVRRNCRTYKAAFKACYPEGSLPLYAGKANAFKQIYRIMREEDMGIDVVSCGERLVLIKDSNIKYQLSIVNYQLSIVFIPKTAPAKVSISPKAARTVGSITPDGGTTNAAPISTHPNTTVRVARHNCNDFFVFFMLCVCFRVSCSVSCTPLRRRIRSGCCTSAGS